MTARPTGGCRRNRRRAGHPARCGRRQALVAWLAVGVTTALAGCSTQHIPLPSDDAAPQAVVRAYADAVHAGDCATALTLVSVARNSWCGSIDITSLRVTATTPEKRAAVVADVSPIERVWVEMTTQGGEVSMPNGRHQWSYLLDRTGPGKPWRIYDQGMG